MKENGESEIKTEGERYTGREDNRKKLLIKSIENIDDERIIRMIYSFIKNLKY